MIQFDGFCAVSESHFESCKAERGVCIVGEGSFVTGYCIVGGELKFPFYRVVAAGIVLCIVALTGEPNVDTIVTESLESATRPTFGEREMVAESGHKLVFA